MYIAISLVLIFIIGILLYISKSLRLDMTKRYLHSRYVFFTIVYSIVCILGFSVNLKLVGMILSIESVESFLNHILSANSDGTAFYWIALLLSNILFLAGFDIMLLFIRNTWIPYVVSTIKEDDYLETDDANIVERFFSNISRRFYNKSEIRPVAENIGVWIRTMKNIFLVMLIAEAAVMTFANSILSVYLPENYMAILVKSLYMLPMASYIILSQTEIFLCADKKEEDKDIETEEIGEKIIGDYTPLISFYNSNFGENALISFYKKGDGDFTHSLYASLDREQLNKSDNPALMSAIYRSLENCAEHISVKFVDSIADLINGANIAVADSEVGEFNIYFLSYLQQQLYLGKKALVICRSERQVDDIIRRYNEIFRLINRITSVWNIRNVETESYADTHILVCTDEQLIKGNLKSRLPEFFDKVSNVIITDSYKLICRDKAFLSGLFDYLSYNKMQYLFYIPENNPDIKTVLEEYINDDIYVYENYNETTNICIMYWRQEQGIKAQRALSPNLQHDFGMAYVIALMAAKFDVTDINIHAPETVPVQSYRNTAAGEYAKVLSSEFFASESVNIDSIIKINNALIFKSKELAFNILYDENNNLLSLTNKWLSYGGKTCSMLHMISRPYMLRDYFAYNLSELSGRLSDVKMFVPVKVLNIHTEALALLLKTRAGIHVSEILDFAHVNRIDKSNAEDILKELLKIVLGENHNYQVYESFIFDEVVLPKFENEKYLYSFTVKMTNQTLYTELYSLTSDSAVLIDKTKRYVLPINKNDVFNRYLPDQCCCVGGNRYRITDIKNGEITAIREESSLGDKEYVSLYNIADIGQMSELDKSPVVENKAYRIKFYSADIKREIWGYLECSNGIDFSADNCTSLKTLSTPIVELKRSNILSVDFKYAFGPGYERIASLLVVLVCGVLETLLPDNYKDMLVFSDVDKNALETGKDEDAIINENDILQLLPNIEKNLLQKNSETEIHLYIAEFSKEETGALYSIASDMERMLLVIKKYTEWVIAHNELTNHYLYFGLGRIPSAFAIDELFAWIDSITPKIKYPDKLLDGDFTIAEARYCSFCGRTVITSGVLLADGRVMCGECAKHRANTKKEVKVLLRRAYNILKNKYGITVPHGIKIKFASQDEVIKAAKTTPGFIPLGVYIGAQNKIMIVRGGPETNVLSTLIHELTHAWQHKNAAWLMTKDNIKTCEGHAMYTEIECMYALKEITYADKLDKATVNRKDVYGEGYRFWKEYMKKETDKNIFHQIEKMGEKNN